MNPNAFSSLDHHNGANFVPTPTWSCFRRTSFFPGAGSASALNFTAGPLGISSDTKRRRTSAIEKAHREAEEERERYKRKCLEQVKEKEDRDEENREMSYARRYEKRLMTNRRSAAASRVRKETYMKSLEKYLKLAERKYIAVESELEAVKEENARLKKDLGHDQRLMEMTAKNRANRAQTTPVITTVPNEDGSGDASQEPSELGVYFRKSFI